MESLANTRGIAPFEPNPMLSFLDQINEEDDPSASPRDTFLDVFKKVSVLMSNDKDQGRVVKPQEVTFRIDTDMHSNILITFIKHTENSNLSDQIVIQDRLFGKIREEYTYLSTDGRGGDIVRIYCGDIAVMNQAAPSAHKRHSSFNESKKEQLATSWEIEAILDCAVVMGNIVDDMGDQAEVLNYPHPDKVYI